jgi:hypothetical protein
MQENGTAWDLTSIQSALSRADQFNVLFLFVVILLILMKLFRVWRPAPPFTLRRGAGDPTHRPKLREICEVVKLWQTFVLFITTMVLPTDTIKVGDRLLASRTLSVSPATYYVRRQATLLAIGVLTAFFAFIVRWHIYSRISRLCELVRSS